MESIPNIERIFLESSRITPLVNFDPEDGLLEMRGRSGSENAIQFYQQVVQGLSEYAENGGESFVASFAFEYFNTSSSKCLFDIFKRLVKIRDSGREVDINWFYEEHDKDMMEAGEDYSDLLEIEFNFIEIEEED